MQPVQLPFPPAARNIDPATSHQAAERITNRTSWVSLVADQVSKNPGLTTGELAYIMGNPPGLWKRISDAKNQGLIVYGKPREYQGRSQQTCWPT